MFCSGATDTLMRSPMFQSFADLCVGSFINENIRSIIWGLEYDAYDSYW